MLIRTLLTLPYYVNRVNEIYGSFTKKIYNFNRILDDIFPLLWMTAFLRSKICLKVPGKSVNSSLVVLSYSKCLRILKKFFFKYLQGLCVPQYSTNFLRQLQNYKETALRLISFSLFCARKHNGTVVTPGITPFREAIKIISPLWHNTPTSAHRYNSIVRCHKWTGCLRNDVIN